MICENEGCPNMARWLPFLIARDANGEVLLEGDTHTAVCDDCKEVATVDAFMDDGQYKAMCEAFTVQGKEPPRRDDIEIELRPL